MTTNNHQFHLLSPEKNCILILLLQLAEILSKIYFYPCCYGIVVQKHAKFKSDSSRLVTFSNKTKNHEGQKVGIPITNFIPLSCHVMISTCFRHHHLFYFEVGGLYCCIQVHCTSIFFKLLMFKIHTSTPDTTIHLGINIVLFLVD